MLSTLIAFLFSISFAHGEDKPGPHQGHIKMPGPFHTEVVPLGPQEYMVYLLDMEFKNPVIKESKVEATLLQGKYKSQLQCEPMHNHFHCRGEDKKITKPKTLTVKAVRTNIKGNEATYALPLKEWTASEAEKDNKEKSKSHHHH